MSKYIWDKFLEIELLFYDMCICNFDRYCQIALNKD